MLKKLLGFSLVIATALFIKANTAQAALTVGANSVVSDGVLTLQGTSLAVTGNTAFSGNIGLSGTAIDANKILNINNTTLTPSGDLYGAYIKVGSTNTVNVFGVQVDAASNPSGPVTQIQGAFIQGYDLPSGTSTINFIIGGTLRSVSQTASPVLNMTGGESLLQNFGSSSTPVGLGSGHKITIQQSSSTAAFTVGVGEDIIVSGSGSAGFGTLYGIRVGNWSGTAPATTSYGIYMDTTIDRGTTKYALYSSATSQSYLQGNLGIGNATPGAKLDVTGHVASSGSAPTPSVTGSGYSGASVGAGSTDTKGSITATVGAAAGTLVVTFNSAYTSAPYCAVTPATATAQVDEGKMYITKGTGALTLNFVATPTGGSETWDYICIQ